MNISNEEVLSDLAELFKMFADSTRIKILYTLLDGSKSVNEIASELEMNQPAISHQLKILKSQKLVRGIRDGKSIYYSLDDEHVSIILNKGMEYIKE